MEFDNATFEKLKLETSLKVGTDEFFQHYKGMTEKSAQRIFDLAKREANILIRVINGNYIVYKNRYDKSGIACSAQDVLDMLQNYPNTVVINY